MEKHLTYKLKIKYGGVKLITKVLKSLQKYEMNKK